MLLSRRDANRGDRGRGAGEFDYWLVQAMEEWEVEREMSMAAESAEKIGSVRRWWLRQALAMGVRSLTLRGGGESERKQSTLGSSARSTAKKRGRKGLEINEGREAEENREEECFLFAAVRCAPRHGVA